VTYTIQPVVFTDGDIITTIDVLVDGDMTMTWVVTEIDGEEASPRQCVAYPTVAAIAHARQILAAFNLGEVK